MVHIPLPNSVASFLNPRDEATGLTFSEKRYIEAVKEAEERAIAEARTAEMNAKQSALTSRRDFIFTNAFELVKAQGMIGPEGPEVAVQVVLHLMEAADVAVFGEKTKPVDRIVGGSENAKEVTK